jgi:ribonuclease P protein component
MKLQLRSSREFQRVYRHGKRFEGILMTIFVLPNRLSDHRLGITASRKALGNAVQRNRAKRLLRETFRLRRSSLEEIKVKYDWVLNAKRPLLNARVDVALNEFDRLLLGLASETAESRIA